jgi:hypothetical protein
LVAIGDEIRRVGRELLALRIEDQGHVQGWHGLAVAEWRCGERHAEDDDAMDERGNEERRAEAFIPHGGGL